MSDVETFKVEHSWEATTLDYLAPHWYEGSEVYATREEAETVAAAKQQANYDAHGEPCYYRVKRVAPKVEVDAFLEAEFAANAQYWAGRAAAAKRAEEAEAALYALKGQQVVVVKGRKVPPGTTGEVFWVGEGKWGWRVGFKDVSGETFWTAVGNVEAVVENEAVGV